MTGMPSATALSTRLSGDAGAREGDDALREEAQQLVVAPERSGAPVPVPVGLAHHLVHAVAFGPLGGDVLDAGAATVHEHHVDVLRLGPVEAVEDGAGVADRTSLPQATSVPCGRCARISRSLRARMKSRASTAAEVSVPICLVWEPRRGRQVSPVSER